MAIIVICMAVCACVVLVKTHSIRLAIIAGGHCFHGRFHIERVSVFSQHEPTMCLAGCSVLIDCFRDCGFRVRVVVIESEIQEQLQARVSIEGSEDVFNIRLRRVV